MRDARQLPFPDTRLLRSARSQWLAALLSVMAAIGVLAIPVEPASGLTRADPVTGSRP